MDKKRVEFPPAEDFPEYVERYTRIPYKWAAGEYVGRFLQELRDNGLIYANRCPKCGRYLVPMRPVCGRCHVRMEGMYTVGPRGTVLAYQFVEQPFPDPSTGVMRAVPYATAIIGLDGAPVTIDHLLEEKDHNRIHVGMRVEAVFKPQSERTAHITDIKYFKTIPEQTDEVK